MSISDRPKRPSPERTQPIRSWSTLFAVPSADGGDPDPPPAAPAPESRGAGLSDVVSRSVDLGYRVIDEYIRQGQKAARRLNDRSYGTQAMTGDLQELGMRMTQYASDFAAVWLEFIQVAATKNGAPGGESVADGAVHPPAATPGDPAVVAASGFTPDEQPAGERTRVRIEVQATQPTEVSVDILPSATRLPLVVHALRAIEPDTPRIAEVAFEAGSDDDPPRLRIRVPPGHPPGVYSGLIIDPHTSRPAGSVSVRIGEA
jgi:hypothetical protein